MISASDFADKLRDFATGLVGWGSSARWVISMTDRPLPDPRGKRMPDVAISGDEARGRRSDSAAGRSELRGSAVTLVDGAAGRVAVAFMPPAFLHESAAELGRFPLATLPLASNRAATAKHECV